MWEYVHEPISDNTVVTSKVVQLPLSLPQVVHHDSLHCTLAPVSFGRALSVNILALVNCSSTAFVHEAMIGTLVAFSD